MGIIAGTVSVIFLITGIAFLIYDRKDHKAWHVSLSIGLIAYSVLSLILIFVLSHMNECEEHDLSPYEYDCYQPTEQFNQLFDYGRYYKDSYVKLYNLDNEYIIINSVEHLNSLREDYSYDLKDYEWEPTIKLDNYNEEFFKNNTLIYYVHHSKNNIEGIKITDIKNNIIELSITESEITKDIKMNQYIYNRVALLIEVDKLNTETIKFEKKYYEPEKTKCHNMPVEVKKPIIYIYPEEETNVEVELVNNDLLTVSYPKYTSTWKVKALTDGTLIDQNNKKYYSLYYESKSILNNTMKNEGFVVSKENIDTFLEEKLTILGLNYKEKEEFIIYWLPKLVENNYTYIRFQSEEEINTNMPLKITPTPNTLIRVIMEFKPLDKYVEVKPQQLEPTTRSGYTVVEWGATEIK